MSGKKIGLVLALDGEKEFSQSVQNAQKSANLFKAELKNLSQQFDGNANSIDALKAKQEALTGQQAAYQQKLEAANAGLNKATQNYNKQGERLQELKKQLEDAQKSLQKMKDAGDTSSDAYTKQAKSVDELSEAVKKQELAQQRETGSITDWNKRIVEVRGQLNEVNKALDQNERYMKEAESATDKCATSIDGFGKEVEETASDLEDAGKKGSTFKDMLAANLAGTAIEKGLDLLKSGAEKVTETMLDASKASTQLAASTGLSESAAKRYQKVMQSIKGDNFGEDYGDVADAMSQVIQVMGELDDSSMKEVTESAIALRDTFDMDVNESIRAADVMMKTMGVDAATAFDLITAGAQNGLNRSGELTDNLTEYASLWGQAGFSAQEMFAILENGLDAGAYNLDKVNDYVKEFGNSLADGRIEENLSSFSADTQNLFQQWKNGNASTSDVFYSVINDLSEMTNQQEALTVASEVWSALGEDNAMQVLTALDDVNDKYKDVRGSMESLKEVKYSDLESSLQNIGSVLQEGIVTPIADAALPGITGAINAAAEGLDSVFNPPKTQLQEFIEEIENSNEEVNRLLENAQETMAGAESDTAELEAYRQMLVSLNETEQKSEFQKYQVKTAVEELKGSIPELSAAFDEESGSIKLTSDEINNLFESQKNLILQQASLSAQEDSYKALYTATLNQAKAESALEEAQKKLAEAEEKNAQSASYAKGELGDYYTEVLEAQIAVEDATKDEKEATEAKKEAQKQYDANSKAVEKTTEKMKELEQGQEGLSESTDKASSSGKEFAQTAESMTEALSGTREAAEAQKTAMDQIVQAYDDAKSEIESRLQDKISPFDMFDGGTDVTTEEMNTHLQSYLDGFENYKTNLEKVREMTDETGKAIFSPEVMAEIEAGGLDMANMLSHIVYTWEEQGEYGVEQTKGIAEKWASALENTEGYSKAEAAAKVAVQKITGELGSTEADFSALKDSIKSATASAAEGWKDLTPATKAALDQAAQTARECGIKIPDGLAEGIASGEISAEEAISQLNGAIQGTIEGVAKIAKDSGIDIPEEITAGINAGGQEAVDAMIQLLGQLEQQKGDAQAAGETVGNEAGSGVKSGMEGQQSEVQQAGENMAQSAAEAVENKSSQFQEAGLTAASRYAAGIFNGAKSSMDAAANMAAQALARAESSTGGFYSAGVSAASGMAAGINAGSSNAVAAAASMASRALSAAKAALDIHSPSRKFKEDVGKQIAKGMAFGISDNASLAGNAAKRMSSKVYTSATKWMSKYKKAHSTTLDDEIYFWQQVQKHTKAGTTAYNNAVKKIQGLSAAKLTASGLSKGASAQIAKNFGVSRTTVTGSGKNRKTVKKDNDTYYGEIYSAAEKYFSNQQILNEWSLEQQLAYWNGVKGQLRSGTQAWYDATAKVQDAQEAIAQAQAEAVRKQASVQSGILDKYKVYYKVSAKAEMEYWNEARKQFRAGTDERIEADQKYLAAAQEYYDQRKEIEEDYAESRQDLNEKEKESIKELEDAYEDAYNSRRDDILSQMGTFDAWDSTGYDEETLIYNLKTQVEGLKLWEQQLEELGNKKISGKLMDELKKMGPDAAASIYSLNHMTEQQLEEYNRLWEEKNALAEAQAAKDMEEMRLETESKKAQIRIDTQAELNALNSMYRDELSELNAGMSAELAGLVSRAGEIGEDAVAGLIAGINKEVTSVDTYGMTADVVEKLASQLKALEEKGKEIGKNTLSGILAGMSPEGTGLMETETKTSAWNLVSNIEGHIAGAAEIHSPSRRFKRRLGRPMYQGILSGFAEGDEEAAETSRDMVSRMMDAAEKEMQRRQETLQAQLTALNFGGIAQINDAMEKNIQASTVVNVDNGNLAALLGALINAVDDLSDKVDRQQLVMDTGALVAAIQPAMSRESAAVAVRRNRGRMR